MAKRVTMKNVVAELGRRYAVCRAVAKTCDEARTFTYDASDCIKMRCTATYDGKACGFFNSIRAIKGLPVKVYRFV